MGMMEMIIKLLNNKKMSKTKNFNLKDYSSGNYVLVSRDGGSVEITAIDENRNTIFGFYNELPTTWDLNGERYPKVSSDRRDLLLRMQIITLHINITRTKGGKIDSYCSTKGKPRVKAGGTLLKYVTLEVEA